MSVQQRCCADCNRPVDADARDCPHCWSSHLIWVDFKTLQAEQKGHLVNDQSIAIYQPDELVKASVPFHPSLESLIAGWLEEKTGRTKSQRTTTAYQATLAAFRRFLHELGLDLDSPAPYIATAAKKWAALSARPDIEIANSTYNLRLAILSSFYRYWQYVQPELEVPNPIARCKRRTIQAYASAQPLSPGQLTHFNSIDRTNLAGLRDYALLAVALSTGRRASELAALCKEAADGQQVIRVEGKSVSLYFKRCKGGKKTRDTLLPPVATAVLAWIKAYYGSYAAMPADAPLWPSLSHYHRGGAISIQAIADICEKHLGTSRVHATRHTFAHKMDEANARVTDIAEKLLHSDLGTLQRYLARLRSDQNPYGEQLAALLGLQREAPDHAAGR